MSEITHQGTKQIVSRGRLRAILRADGETCYCAPDAVIEWDAGPCPDHDAEPVREPVRELVLVLNRGAWGAGVTAEEHAALCTAAEEWLTANEGDSLSIRVRPSRAGEVEGLRAVRSGVPTGPDLRRLEPDLADLTNRAWGYVIDHAGQILGGAK